MNTTLKDFLLVIKTGNKSYLPIEWETIKDYNHENLYTLEGIDAFTSRFIEAELLIEALDQNIISNKDPFRKITIIYKENGKEREVKEGVIYRDSDDVLTEQEFLDVLFDAISNDDKATLNDIIMQCNIKGVNEDLDRFIYVLKNASMFKEKGPNGIKAAISFYNYLPYEIRRKIRLKVSKKVIFKR
jgi:hypothetical protein